MSRLKTAVDDSKRRSARLAILGPSTARCEKCLADCTGTIGEWAVDGLCTRCHQQKVAGR